MFESLNTDLVKKRESVLYVAYDALEKQLAADDLQPNRILALADAIRALEGEKRP